MRAEKRKKLVENTVLRKYILPQKPADDAGDYARQIINHPENTHAFDFLIYERCDEIARNENYRHAHERIETSVSHNAPKISVFRQYVLIVRPAVKNVVRTFITVERIYERLKHRISREHGKPDYEGKDEHPPLAIVAPEFFRPFPERKRLFIIHLPGLPLFPL